MRRTVLIDDAGRRNCFRPEIRIHQHCELAHGTHGDGCIGVLFPIGENCTKHVADARRLALSDQVVEPLYQNNACIIVGSRLRVQYSNELFPFTLATQLLQSRFNDWQLRAMGHRYAR